MHNFFIFLKRSFHGGEHFGSYWLSLLGKSFLSSLNLIGLASAHFFFHQIFYFFPHDRKLYTEQFSAEDWFINQKISLCVRERQRLFVAKGVMHLVIVMSFIVIALGEIL